MTVAGIDIGTNTLLMVVAEVSSDGTITTLEDLHEIPRLGAGVDAAREIAPEGVARAAAVLQRYRQVLQRYGNPPVFCVGTSALRDAANQRVVLDALEVALESTIDVIDGETEARLTYRGSVGDVMETAIVCDIGGGSTELAYGLGGVLEQRVSLQIGCVRLSERWCSPGPVDEVRQAGLTTDIRTALGDSGFKPPSIPVRVVGVAGTPSALATMDLGLSHFDPQLIEGHQLAISAVRSMRDRLLAMNETQLTTLTGVDPRRADILPAGAAILLDIMEFLGAPEVEVSTGGLRYGAALVAAGIST